MIDYINNARTYLACALRWACRMGFHEGVALPICVQTRVLRSQ